MQYKKQRDKFRCGPIAILNALRWAGSDYDLNKIGKKIGCKREDGVQLKPFHKGLRHFGKDLFTITKRIQPSIRYIEDQLYSGESVLVNFKFRIDKKIYGHYVFVDYISKTGQTFGVVNMFSKGPTYQYISRRKFIERVIYGARHPEYPSTAWLLRKKNAN